MERPRLHLLGLLGAVLLSLGCQSLRSGGTPEALRQLDGDTLTTIVAELKMHLREDSYRFDRAQTSDGRDVIAVSLWKLDRLQRLRAVPRSDWENVDLVIEFARARALERLRRYAEAREAFERVAASGSVLSDPAFEAAAVMARFRHFVDEPGGTDERELARIQSRVVYWRMLAHEFADTSYQSLALEEFEAWQMLSIDSIQRTEGSARAISSCKRLIEENRSSKLYSRHLIRLGDLYAHRARSVALRSRTEARLDMSHYEQLIDRALAAYELAAEDRRPNLRKEATTRIDALLAYHQGTLAYAQ
jgi:tetratricopeptide (TPR) repeat protein